MIGQELQIILVKLELQRMLLQNLQRYGKMDKDRRGSGVGATAALFPPRVRLRLHVSPAHG